MSVRLSADVKLMNAKPVVPLGRLPRGEELALLGDLFGAVLGRFERAGEVFGRCLGAGAMRCPAWWYGWCEAAAGAIATGKGNESTELPRRRLSTSRPAERSGDAGAERGRPG